MSSRSLGSGHLASVEHSETSDTLIDYSIEHDNRVSTPSGPTEELPHDEEEPLGLVRSPEMFFQQDSKLNGSVITISSASDTATVIQQDSKLEPMVARPVQEDVMQKYV